MKNNKMLIIIGVVLLNVIVVFMFAQSLLGKTNVYDQTLIDARALVEQNLCSKAIDKYNEAIVIEDTLETRIEMLKAYEKGLEIGEFTNPYSIFVEIDTIVDMYKTDLAVYETACDIFLKYEKYEECANLLMQARDLKVTSEKIEEARAKVRYQFMKVYAMYTEVMPTFDGMITAVSENEYSFLSDEASPDLSGGFVYATSFSEGYAFVQTSDAEGNKLSFVINKDGQRQFYVENAESSSGVGKAMDADKQPILLLTCKAGDTYDYYDMNGNKLLSGYSFGGRFRNNVAAVKDADGKWRIINGVGEAVSDKVFEDVILNEFDECAPKGHIIAKENGAYHIYDINLNQVGDFSCEFAKAFVDDYAAFRNGELWGFVGADGNVIIEPQYEDAKSFSNLMGAVKTGDGWSLINPANEVVVNEIYEDVSYLNDKGICFVKFDGFWSYLDMYYTGK